MAKKIGVGGVAQTKRDIKKKKKRRRWLTWRC